MSEENLNTESEDVVQESAAAETDTGTDNTQEAAVTETPEAKEAKEPKETKLDENATVQEKIAALAKAADDKAKNPEVKDPKKVVDPANPEAAAAAFTPNHKIKIHNSLTKVDKEFEIPKEFQALMKDPKSEKQVRELFERSYGLDVVKERLQAERVEKATVHKENAEIKASIQDLSQIYQKSVQTGNYLGLDQFFQKLQIPPEHILQYALAKIQYSELPPEQRQVLDARFEAERRAESLTQENSQVLTRVQESASQIKTIQLESCLARPDTSAIAQAFDAQVGRPGAFKLEIIRQGRMAYVESGGQVDLTPDQAIEEVVKNFNLKAPVAAAVATPAAAAVTPAPGSKPVVVRTDRAIPNLQGGSASPLKTKPNSSDDIRKLYKQKLAEAQGM